MSKQTDTPENSNFGNNVRIFPGSSGDIGNIEMTGTLYTDTLTENTTGAGTLIHNILFNGNNYTLTNTSVPSNPTSGKQTFYLDTTDGFLKSKNSTGVVTTYNPLTTKGDIPVHNGTTTIRQSVGANSTFLLADNSQSTGLLWTTFKNSGLFRYYYIYDSKTQGTNGGSYTSPGNYITRTLNTIETSHGDTNVSLSSNQMTFLEGNYIIKVSAPATGINEFRIRLFNVTDNLVTKLGTGEYSSALSTQARSWLIHYINISSTKIYTVQFIASGLGTSSISLGRASGFSTEIYTTVEIIRLS